MYTAFAYSPQMQIILAIVVFVVEFLQIYLLAGLISIVFKLPATKRQKALFAFFTGTILQNVWVYGLYILGGMESFTRLQHQLITSPNPIAAMLYCYCAIKIFKLSPIRSIKTMSYVYLFWFICKKLSSVMGCLFFEQTGSSYNYLLDATKQICILLIFTQVYRFVKYLVVKKHFTLIVVENYYANPKKELFFYFLKASVAYSVSIALAVTIPEHLLSSLICFFILALFFAIIMLVDRNRYNKQLIENSSIHISTLLKGNEEFRSVKHDFYNILQTYTGYLELEDISQLKKYHQSLIDVTVHAGTAMELGQRMNENPALMALLSSKLEYAERSGVRLRLSLRCSLVNTYIDNVELCRALSCLLDNAIEAAASSEEKRAYFSCEHKSEKSILFIITNSTDVPVNIEKFIGHGASSKPGHSGIGLTSVRSMVDKHSNCAFQMKYYDFEVSTYLELMEE